MGKPNVFLALCFHTAICWEEFNPNWWEIWFPLCMSMFTNEFLAHTHRTESSVPLSQKRYNLNITLERYNLQEEIKYNTERGMTSTAHSEEV